MTLTRHDGHHRAPRLRATLFRSKWMPVISLVALVGCAPAVVRQNEAGNERFAEGVYEEAVDAYRLAQVDDPDRAEPYYNAANAYNRMRQVDPALAQTEQALKTAHPELAARAWYNLGNAFFDAEQWPQAVEAYKEALRLQPGDLDAKHNLELALRRLDEQQQEKDQQSADEIQEQNGQAEPAPEPESESESSPSQQSGEDDEQTEQPTGSPQERAQGLTEEQAIRLLEALLGDSRTLQERLEQEHSAPGLAPEQDW